MGPHRLYAVRWMRLRPSYVFLENARLGVSIKVNGEETLHNIN